MGERLLRDGRARVIGVHRIAGSLAAWLRDLADLAQSIALATGDPRWADLAKELDGAAARVRTFA